MGSRPGNRMSRSLNGIRSSVAVLRMAPPFSPARDFSRTPAYSPTARNCKKLISVYAIPPRDCGFESQEPTSPKISCIGHIKMKPPQWEKSSKQVGAAVKEIGNLAKLKKLMLRRNRKNSKAEGEETVNGEEGKIGYPSLAQIKRHTSDSYDTKFGGVYVEEGPIVAKSESLMLEAESGINIWKRRCIPPLKALEVSNQARAERFEPRKPLTT